MPTKALSTAPSQKYVTPNHKRSFNLIHLHILPCLSPLMTRQIKFPYSKIILMKCLESDHNTVKEINWNWQNKEKDISGMESWSWFSRKVYICIRHMASLKSGQTRGSFTASGITVNHYNLKWPILKKNKCSGVGRVIVLIWVGLCGEYNLQMYCLNCNQFLKLLC